MDFFDIFQQYKIEQVRSEALSHAGEAKYKATDNTIKQVQQLRTCYRSAPC